MPKDLKGKELLKGIYQRKDGRGKATSSMRDALGCVRECLESAITVTTE